jgi:hypothetical protein
MIGHRHAAAIAAAMFLFCAASAGAQPVPAPPPPPGEPAGEAGQVRACLCEQQEIGALRTVMDEKKQSLDAIRRELTELDAQLVSERPRVDVNDPNSVERYKALLARHDAAYQRSIGPVVGDAVEAVNRYNQRVAHYNDNCGHQLFDAAVMASVRATLTCTVPR